MGWFYSSRILSRVATPQRQTTCGATSTPICLRALTHLCQWPRRELGRVRRPWRARGACLTRGEPRPAWGTGSSSYASCRQRWSGWRGGARTWRGRRKRMTCRRRVSPVRGSETQQWWSHKMPFAPQFLSRYEAPSAAPRCLCLRRSSSFSASVNKVWWVRGGTNSIQDTLTVVHGFAVYWCCRDSIARLIPLRTGPLGIPPAFLSGSGKLLGPAAA